MRASPVGFLIVPLYAVLDTLPLLAFNPPTDTVGPLTVTIGDLGTVTARTAPVPVEVVLKNGGDAPLQGTVRLGLVDDWRVEGSPRQTFELAGRQEKTLHFSLVAGERTYSALYPLHAWVAFRAPDEPEQTAHAVLIFATQFPLPEPPRRELEPVEVPPQGAVALWRLSAYRVVWQQFGRDWVTMPVGWQGSEPTSRMLYRPNQRVSRGGVVKETLNVHPPWWGGAGTVYGDYLLHLPKVRPLVLTFSMAIRDHDPEREPPSDGVTFRVWVGQTAPEEIKWQQVFVRHTDTKVWETAEVDLSPFAGQRIWLRLETHPGPNNDTTCDSAYWGEPTLVSGRPPQPPPPPDPRTEPGETLFSRDEVGKGGVAVRLWRGSQGILDSRLGFDGPKGRVWWEGFRVEVNGEVLNDWRSQIKVADVEWRREGNRWLIVHHLHPDEAALDLTAALWVEGGALRIRFTLQRTGDLTPERQPIPPRLSEVSPGPFSEPVRRLYAGFGNVIAEPQAPFVLGAGGEKLTTRHVGLEWARGLSLLMAVDNPPDSLEVNPEQRLYALHAHDEVTFTFIPETGTEGRDTGGGIWEAVKRYRELMALPRAAGVEKLAGRFVFDLWGGRYAESAAALQRAARYGLTEALVVWHNWQRWGYDYRLPDIYPPNPQFGTLEEFQRLVQVCKANGILFAPHDNYIDFYPDATDFSYRHICFTAGGQPVRAWYNRGRDAQSYRFRPDHALPFVKRNLRLVREGFAPTAYFIDVFSSIRAFDYYDWDGNFHSYLETRDCWGEIFDFVREYLGNAAPQISEDGNDWLIGWLDGGQGNFQRVDPHPPEDTWATWRVRCLEAERVPWFDAAHHEKFVLHGAGYGSRYAGGLDQRDHGVGSDDYLCTTLLAGHPAMVSQPFSRSVVHDYWLTHDLARILALVPLEQVEFAGGDLHRQIVTWANGATVYVNRGETDWEVAGQVLPPFGFWAEAGEVKAGIIRRQGVVADFAQSPTHLFVDARPLPPFGGVRVKPQVAQVRHLGGRQLEIVFTWDVQQELDRDYLVYVHFIHPSSKQGEKIAFQGDHRPEPGTRAWRGRVQSRTRVTVPDEWKPGEYGIRVGLWDPERGRRLRLQGQLDSTGRNILGTLVVEGKDETVTDIRFVPPKPEGRPVRWNVAGKSLDFGPVVTDGAFRLSLTGEELELLPLPDSPAFGATVHLRQLLARPVKVQRVQIIDEERQTVGELDFTFRDGVLHLQVPAGIFGLRMELRGN